MARQKIHSITKKDFIIQPFKASGPGGQHRNKNATAIRIIHPESGARAECKEHKSQKRNKETAFSRLIKKDKFKSWHRIEVARALYGQTEAERKLQEWMRPENFKVEVYKDEGWVEEDGRGTLG